MEKSKVVLEVVKSRKTTYDFSQERISKTDLMEILEAGQWGPSCSNIQPWHFLIIKDSKKINEVMKEIPYGAFHTNPKILIAILLMKELCDGSHRCVESDKVGIYEGSLSVAMAAQNMTLVAESKGIGSAILTPRDEDTKRILKIKKGDQIPLIIGLGYEKKNTYHKNRTRKNLKELISFETY